MKNATIFLLSLAFFACGKKEIKTDTNPENSEISNQIVINKQQFENEKMALGTFIEHEFISFVKANGMIDVPPENRAIVSTFLGGYVSKIPLLIGDYVKKGQFVASLTNTEFVEIQQNYLEISSQLNFLKNEFERQKTLYNEKISSQKNYLKAESDYKGRLAIYSGLRKKLQMMQINPSEVEKGNFTSTINIYAPIEGFVSDVKLSNGSFFSSASELMEIVNTKQIHLELNVFEKDILSIKKDQKVKFKVPEASETFFNADVHLVGTTITSDRTVNVHCDIDKQGQNFMPGMFVEAQIIVESQHEIALPNSAIIIEDQQPFLLVVKEQKNDETTFEKRLVLIGKKDEEFSQIINFEDFKNKKILIKGGFMF
ncbi:MAG: efflux RND transporter periplasmic adaptor subunit [Flavobacteriia bacterium]|nr:efflux RND transporter periplasmic adaptor subunit [Flavobacteriia bacterium]OIP45478.1 MAG: efflux transporter periplasmic adaptor subunit [Flavobacteriaceae bacterium CG2_30_31_66]PIV97641.1 MAG: efflux transporter periplasmic adaptor subunit [Flavobacteriaceae bacterium CG17_big_fil_post_rev_8_21_14_2_50_31_13]PIY14908.1 MAG: efflux transporter periplasmic adaptor subunit [Flavobacteriaceae bacterium CG_4_10_14_3_um_filter_31_253]PIZ11748.1 MAG: efflux transporter periplasmic adaptor subu